MNAFKSCLLLGFVALLLSGCGGGGSAPSRGEVVSGSASATLTSIEFVSVSKSQLNLASATGAQDASIVIFQLLDESNQPIAGEEVTFSLSTTQGGITFADGAQTGTSDADGNVSTTVLSGSFPTSVTVTAESGGLSGVSSEIVVSLGFPVADKISISADGWNVLDAAYVDGIEVSVTIRAADQYGNPVAEGTRVNFVSPEGGNIGDHCELSAEGACSVSWFSQNIPLDGRMSIMAYTTGAEKFTDVNGNGVYDSGDIFEPEDDLGEAYLDANENGAYELGEFYVDSNGNGVRDIGNGVWDGLCLRDIDSSALCPTNDGGVTIADGGVLTAPWSRSRPVLLLGSVSGTVQPFPGEGGAIQAGITYGGLYVADGNPNSPQGGNPMPTGTTIEFSTDNGTLTGSTSWEVGNQSFATGPYSVDVSPDDENSEGLLTLTVSSGGIDYTFQWVVID